MWYWDCDLEWLWRETAVLSEMCICCCPGVFVYLLTNPLTNSPFFLLLIINVHLPDRLCRVMQPLEHAVWWKEEQCWLTSSSRLLYPRWGGGAVHVISFVSAHICPSQFDIYSTAVQISGNAWGWEAQAALCTLGISSAAFVRSVFCSFDEKHAAPLSDERCNLQHVKPMASSCHCKPLFWSKEGARAYTEIFFSWFGCHPLPPFSRKLHCVLKFLN